MLTRRRAMVQTAAAAASGLGLIAAMPAMSQSGSDGSILLGQSVALTGPLGEIGGEYRSGAMLWFDHVNASGGINGRRIRLISIDDRNDVDLAVLNVRNLVEKEKVLAVFGQFGTGPTRAAFSSTIHQGVPVFAPYTGADSLRDYGNRYLFHVRASYGDELRHTVAQLLTTGVRSVAVVYQEDGFGQAALHGAVKALQQQKSEAVVTAAIPVSPTIDVAPAVTAISAKRPAAIIMCCAGNAAVAFVRKYREAGAPAQYYALSEVGSKLLASELGSAARGIVVSQVVPSPWSTVSPISLEYQTLRGKKNAVASSYGSLEGFIAAKVFCEGLRRAGSGLTREGLVDALESMREQDFGGFRVSYGPGSRNGSKFVDLSMLTASGEFVR